MKNANDFSEMTEKYFNYCVGRKNLDKKTIKCYHIDLNQYKEYIDNHNLIWYEKAAIEQYIDNLHAEYKPKSVKRKIASIKAFFHYLEIEDIFAVNPFHKIQIKYKEPFILPKIIPIKSIETIISFAYEQYKKATSAYSKKVALRNILILEMLFATGIRISELCSLKSEHFDYNEYIVKIYGKGAKERLIQICNENVQLLIDQYKLLVKPQENPYYFTNRLHNRLSEQSVRNMINEYAERAKISQHITPHMFRHSFATLLLEEDVDIRYIQQMLGHSSITTTQIYTYTSLSKQKKILATKHPRNKFNICF